MMRRFVRQPTSERTHEQIWWTFIPLLWNKRLQEGV